MPRLDTDRLEARQRQPRRIIGHLKRSSSLNMKRNASKPWVLRHAPPATTDTFSAKAFIMACPPRPEWGLTMEQALRGGFDSAGFVVTRCACLQTHGVVRIRMRGPAGRDLRGVRRLLRTVAKELGHNVTDCCGITVARSGLVTGAFVMDCEVPGAKEARAEILRNNPQDPALTDVDG